MISRGVHSQAHLQESLQAAIDEGRTCAFVPSLKTMRGFVNTEGCKIVMAEVNARLRGHRVIIEPNVYGAMHVFAVGPVVKP